MTITFSKTVTLTVTLSNNIFIYYMSESPKEPDLPKSQIALVFIRTEHIDNGFKMESQLLQQSKLQND